MPRVCDQPRAGSRLRRRAGQRPPRWLLPVLAVLLVAGAARAQAAAGSERVLVLSLVDSGVGFELARRITSMLRTEVAAVVGSRYVDATGMAETERCPLEDLASCASTHGKQARVDLVLVGTVAALADVQLVDLRVIDVGSAAETARLQGPLGSSAEENRRALRELAVRLLAPATYVGTLVVDNLADGDLLMVDGSAVTTEVPTTRVAVPVGQHAVEVMFGEQSRLSEVVDVGFEQVYALRVGGDEAGAAAAEAAPAWPFWTAVGVSAVATVATVGLVTYALIADAERARNAENLAKFEDEGSPSCPTKSREDDPTGECFRLGAEYWGGVSLSAFVSAGASALVAAGSAIAAVFLFPGGSEASESFAATP